MATTRFLCLLILIVLMSGSAAPKLLAQSSLEQPAPADSVYDAATLSETDQPLYDQRELKRLLRYPDDALSSNIEGVVTVRCVIDSTGGVIEVEAIESDNPLLTEAALDAVQRLNFRPGTRDGRPVSVRVTIPVRFSLTEDSTPDSPGE